MNKIFDLKLSQNQMIEIGKRLGADVPATFFNVPIIARGIGEKIEKINSNFKYYIVIVKPKFSCNTKMMYEKLDKENLEQKINSVKIKMALEKNDIKQISKNMYNVFEIEVENIENIKKDIIFAGANASLMTGSGSAVFGIFEDKKKAKRAYKILSEKYKTFYCISYSRKG